MRLEINSRVSLERGQVLIIVAFALIGLVGITGLAIDGGMAFSDRRHAQNAADTAALAGALAKIQVQRPVSEGGQGLSEVDSRTPMRLAALDRAQENGYSHNLLTSTVEVYTCDEVGLGASCAAPYVGDSDFIQVIITSHIDTYFAQLIGISQVHNRVQAIARADDDDSGPIFDGSAIVALAPTGKGCDGEFIVGGSGTVTIKGGGIFVNSDNTLDDLDSTTCGALKQDGCKSTLDFVDGGGIVSVGNINLNSNCSDNLEGPMEEGADQIDFPPDLELDEPAECEISGKIVNNSAMKTSTIFPGSYDNIPPKAASESNIVMQPGNYCINDFKISSKDNVSGNDVFVYVKPGGSFNLSGGVMTLDAPDTGAYKGYLVYVVPPNSGFEDCTMNGNTSAQFTGTIYAPYCDITINGSSDPEGIHSQIIGYTVKLNGDNDLYIEYDPGENGEDVQPPQIGLAH
jgi:hypothetical protein